MNEFVTGILCETSYKLKHKTKMIQ